MRWFCFFLSAKSLLLLLLCALSHPAMAQERDRVDASIEAQMHAAETNLGREAPGATHSTRSVVLKPARGCERHSAHRTANPLPHRFSARPDSGSANVALPIILGIVGGAVGLYAGTYAGYEIATADGCERLFCGLGGAAIGALVGEAVGLSLGVHLGTDRRAPYLPVLLSAAGTSLFGVLLASSFEKPALLLGVPVAQIAVTIPLARESR